MGHTTHPFGLSPSKPGRKAGTPLGKPFGTPFGEPFDQLRANGRDEAQPDHAPPAPFRLSLSKPRTAPPKTESSPSATPQHKRQRHGL